MTKPEIPLAAAKAMIAAGEACANTLSLCVTIVVLDRGGDLVAMVKMDGAWPGGFNLARGKAQTARSFFAPSSSFVPLIQPGHPLFAVQAVNAGKYVILAGGLPINVEGAVIGAIAVSGGAPEQDEKIAEAALAAFPDA